MTQALNPSEIGLDNDAILRMTRAVELSKLLETSAYFAREWYGADYLVIDRTGNPDTAAVKASIGDRLVDLWDLDPVLWDDTHWAGLRFVDVSDIAIIRPRLHRP